MNGPREIFSLGLDHRDRLNEELGGGIPPGSIVLVEGDYGAGKSVLCQRFTYGLCQVGRTVTYLSTEQSVFGFLDQMESLNYDVADHLLNQELLFLHAELDRRDAAAADGDGERRDLLNRLMEAEVMWSTDVVIIDTFDDILRADPKFESLVRNDEGRQAALEIISFFRDVVSTGKVVILTVDPSSLDAEALGPFRAIADAHFELQMIEVGNSIRRQIKIHRFSGMGEQVGDTIGYSVRSNAGLIVERMSVA